MNDPVVPLGNESVWRLGKQSAVLQTRLDEYRRVVDALDRAEAEVGVGEFLADAERLSARFSAHGELLASARDATTAATNAHQEIFEASARAGAELDKATRDLAAAQDHHALALVLEERADRVGREAVAFIQRINALLG